MRSTVQPYCDTRKHQRIGGDQRQRQGKDSGEAAGQAQDLGRQPFGVAVLIRGIDQDDQRRGGHQQKRGGVTEAPQRAETGERQAGKEARNDQGDQRQQPGQQGQSQRARAAHQGRANVGQVQGAGRRHGGDRNGEPFVLDQPSEKFQLDQCEQARAQPQQQPEGADKGAAQGQLHRHLPGDIEMGGITRPQAMIDMGAVTKAWAMNRPAPPKTNSWGDGMTCGRGAPAT